MLTEQRKTDINKRIYDVKTAVLVQDGKVMAKIGFTNCAYGTITAMKLKIHGYNSFSEAVSVDGSPEFIMMIQDLNILPLQAKEDMIMELPAADIRKIDVLPYQICYSDGMVVNVESPDVIEYQIEKLQSQEGHQEEDITEEEQLTCIRRIQKNAIGYPKKHPLGWICICGELNKEDNSKCAVCGSEKEVLFSACTKTQVIKKCHEVRAVKQADAEKSIAESKNQEAVQELKQQQKKKRLLIAAAVCIVAVALAGFHYVNTYGMKKEERVQWAEALQLYDDWKTDTSAALRAHDAEVKKFNKRTYTFSEIVAISELDESRYAALDQINEINQIIEKFPEKYQPVFEKIAKCQETFYARSIDDSTIDILCDQKTKNANASSDGLNLYKEVRRLEEYLNDKYLNTDKMDLRISVSLSYTPKFFSYTFDSGKSLTSSVLDNSQMEAAQEAADIYCRRLAKKQPSISKITYTGTSSSSASYAYFEYRVIYVNGTSRIGEVTVKKNASSTWEAVGLEFD